MHACSLLAQGSTGYPHCEQTGRRDCEAGEVALRCSSLGQECLLFGRPPRLILGVRWSSVKKHPLLQSALCSRLSSSSTKERKENVCRRLSRCPAVRIHRFYDAVDSSRRR